MAWPFVSFEVIYEANFHLSHFVSNIVFTIPLNTLIKIRIQQNQKPNFIDKRINTYSTAPVNKIDLLFTVNGFTFIWSVVGCKSEP